MPLPSVVVGAGRIEPGAHVDVGATITVKDHAQTIVVRRDLLVTHVDRDGRATVAASPDDAAAIEKVLGMADAPFALLDDGDMRVAYVHDGSGKAAPVAAGDTVDVYAYSADFRVVAKDGTTSAGGGTILLAQAVAVHDVIGESVGLVVGPVQAETMIVAGEQGVILLLPPDGADPREPAGPSPQKGIVPIASR